MPSHTTVMPDIILRRRSPSSFDCGNVPALDDWLQTRGYRPLPPKNSTEYARLQRGASLIVLYNSGSIVLQGSDVAGALALLRHFIGEGS